MQRNILTPLGINDSLAYINGNSIYFANGYQSSAKDLAKKIALVANDGEYNGKQILSKSTIAEIEKVESNLRNQTIAFVYENGKHIRIGNMYRDYYVDYGKYGVKIPENCPYVSYDANTGDGFVLVIDGQTSNGGYDLFNDISQYAYAL